MEKYKFDFSQEDSREIVEVLIEEYDKGLVPLKNVETLGKIKDKFYDEFGNTDKNYKITIEVV